jgi:hypothetical protein
VGLACISVIDSQKLFTIAKNTSGERIERSPDVLPFGWRCRYFFFFAAFFAGAFFAAFLVAICLFSL